MKRDSQIQLGPRATQVQINRLSRRGNGQRPKSAIGLKANANLTADMNKMNKFLDTVAQMEQSRKK